jgi:hypothetical protein
MRWTSIESLPGSIGVLETRDVSRIRGCRSVRRHAGGVSPGQRVAFAQSRIDQSANLCHRIEIRERFEGAFRGLLCGGLINRKAVRARGLQR